MDTEIEAKFVDVNLNEVRENLKKLGADLVHPEFLMRRKVYEHPTNKQNDWFRVREEYGKITMSYKKLNDRTIKGTSDITFAVPDFDQACRFLEGAGLKYVSYQETKRETWRFGKSEITLDTWPWIPPLVEIEAGSEDEVKSTTELLGFDFKKALYGSVENVYAIYYDVSEEEVCDWPEISFKPVPDWLESKRKEP